MRTQWYLAAIAACVLACGEDAEAGGLRGRKYPHKPPTGSQVDTTILTHPANPTSSTVGDFTFSSNTVGAAFQCSLDLASFTACIPLFTTPPLADGSHNFRARALDPLGNFDPSPASFTWVIDTTAPETVFDSTPSDPTSDTTGDFAFSADDPSATFQCSLDLDSFTACISPYTTVAISEGLHSFRVRAIDALNNTDATPATFAWVVDTTAPETTIDTTPDDVTNDPTGDFTFSSDELDATFECSIDLASFTVCTSPHATATLADGSHNFRVRALDTLGNADPSPASFTWTVDTTAPETVFDSTPSDPTSDTTGDFTFSSVSMDVTFECSLDLASFTVCTSPHATAALADGSHNFRARAIDGLSQVDPSPASFTWTVDTTAPDTTFSSTPSDPTSDTTGDFTFTSNDVAATFQCSIDLASYVSCTSPHATATLADGSHNFRARATDALGNVESSPASFTWTVDTTPPDTTILTNPSSPTSDSTGDFTFSSTTIGATFQCSLDLASFTVCTSPHATAALADGSHNFRVRAVNDTNTVDPSPASFTWTVDTTAPNTTITVSPLTPTIDTTGDFEFTSTEAGTFQCSIDSGSFTTCTTPHATAVLAEGAHNFRVRAVDAAGNTDASPASYDWVIDFNVLDTNDPFEESTPWVQNTCPFTIASSHRIDAGVISELAGATRVLISMWLYNQSASWGSNRALVVSNTAGHRLINIQAQPNGANGALSIGFGGGSSIVTAYVPDGYLSPRYWHHLLIYFNGGVVTVRIDDRPISGFQNPSNPSWPTVLGSSPTNLIIGATNTTTLLADFTFSNIAIWTGYAPSSADMDQIWGYGAGAQDLRNYPGAASLRLFIPCDVSPVVDLMGHTLGGNLPPVSNTNLPYLYEQPDELFVRKHAINIGKEPWMAPSGTPPLAGGNHSTSPSLVRLSDQRLGIMSTRGDTELINQKAVWITSNDDGISTPISGRTWPPTPSIPVESVVTGMNAPSGPGSSIRLITATRIPSLGTIGRIFAIARDLGYATSAPTTACSITSGIMTCTVSSGHPFSVGDYVYTEDLSPNVDILTTSQVTATTPTSVSFARTGVVSDGVGTVFRANDTRRVRIVHSDDDGATWVSPYLFPAADCTGYADVGHAHVTQLPDDSLVFGYSCQKVNEVAVDGRLARSTDGGLTWSSWVTVAASTNRISGALFRDPYCDYVPQSSGTVLYCMLHTTSGVDPRINNGAQLNDQALRSVSTDDGLTWSIPTVLFDLARQPVWHFREVDHLMVVETTAISNNPTPPLLRFSRDGGIVWTNAQEVPSALAHGRDMRGALIRGLSAGNHLLFAYAQEWSTAQTEMWVGQLRESWILSVAP